MKSKLIQLTEPKSVLKPTEFQDFELKEKTVISHNVAMLVPFLHTARKKLT